MRTLTATERGYVSDPAGHSCFAYLEVTADDGATWKNLGALAVGSNTRDFLTIAQITNSIDSNTVAFSATLKREIDLDSLSPLRTDSAVNDSVVTPGTYAPLLELQRKWRIKAAIVAKGTVPDISDYRDMESGYIRTLTVNGLEDTIAVSGIGLEAPILDAFIVDDRTYSDAMEDVIQGALDDQLGQDVIALYTPTSPSFIVNDTIGDINLMPALSDIAALIGWSLRYRYDASDVNQFTLFEPDRSATVAEWTIAATEYEDLTASLDISGVRNYIKVRYNDPTAGVTTVISPGAESGTVSCVGQAATFSTSQAAVLADGALIVVDDVGYRVSSFDGTTGCTLVGAPDFTAKQFYTSASLTKYGLQTFVIDLAASTQITTSTSAGNLADAVRADREDPALVQSFKAPGLWFVQLHDFVGTTANGVHYDADQTGGVTSYTHDFADGMLVTTVNLAGKPKGRYTTWKRIGSGAGASVVLPAVINVTATAREVIATTVFSGMGVVAVASVNSYTKSVTFELSAGSDFSSVLSTVAVDVVNGTADSTWGSGFVDSGTTYYVRATPYSAPSGVGTAGDAAIANTDTRLAPSDSPTTTIDFSTAGEFQVNVTSVPATALPADVETGVASSANEIGTPLVFYRTPLGGSQWLALSTIPATAEEVGSEYRHPEYAVGAGRIRLHANVKSVTGTPTLSVKSSADDFGTTPTDCVTLSVAGTGWQSSDWATLDTASRADVAFSPFAGDGADTGAVDLYALIAELLPDLVTAFRDFSDDFSDGFS